MGSDGLLAPIPIDQCCLTGVGRYVDLDRRWLARPGDRRPAAVAALHGNDGVSTAARVEPGQTLITVKVKANALEIAKEALKRGSAKLSIPCRITVEKIKSPDATAETEMETA